MTDTSLSIRSAGPEDAVAVAALAAQLAAHEGGASHFTVADFRRDGVGEHAAFSMLVAEKDGKLIGFAMFYPGYDLATASRGAHLGDIVVDVACRGRGVGKALMAALAERVLASGGKWISFTVLRDNDSAARFYEALQAQVVPVDFMAWGESGLRRLHGERAA